MLELVVVCSYARAEAEARAFAPTHAVSLLDLDLDPPALGLSPERHLALEFLDTLRDEGPGSIQPEHARRLVAFLRDALAGPAPCRLLVHCFQGLSRSPAAACAAFYLAGDPPDGEASLRRVRALVPRAWPNRRLLTLLDAELAAAGALCAPWARLRRRGP